MKECSVLEPDTSGQILEIMIGSMVQFIKMDIELANENYKGFELFGPLE